jgi:UDP-2,3-diacylglucosamine pyrophosphatase LpxH
MNIIKQELINFLVKHGKPKSWKKTYDLFPYLGEITNKQKSDYVRLLFKNITKMSSDLALTPKESVPNDTTKVPSNLILKSRWQGPSGDWLESYKNIGIDSQEQKVSLQEIINNLDFKSIPVFKNTFKGEGSNNEKLICITDVHLGMSAEGNIFNKKWCLGEYYKRLNEVISKVERGDNVTLTVLGDFTDGLKGRTARGGHKLPQNLSDEEMFAEGLTSLVYLMDALSSISKKVTVYFLINSNHPGVTDHNISKSIEKFHRNRWKNINWVTCGDFITPVEISGHDYLLTHGYDDSLMMRGLPRFYADKEINKLRNITEHYNLNKPTILRGDLHQYTNVDYDYFQDIIVPAFSSPSGWISINFFSRNNGGFLIGTFNEQKPSYTLFKF